MGITRTNILSMQGITGYNGTSITSMTDLAKSKQYTLLANVGCNAIFVKCEYLNLFYDSEVTPHEVFTYEGHRIGQLSFAEMRRLGLKRVLEPRRWRLSKLFSH
jgi:hypothetical protein